MVIQRSQIVSTSASIIANKSTIINAQKLAALHKFLKELEPKILPEILLSGDTKYGIIDSLLFEKSKPDKNNIHSNIKLIQRSFDNLKDLITAFQSTPYIFNNNVATIAYKPINDNYHYILIKKLNINKNNIEKYLLLI